MLCLLQCNIIKGPLHPDAYGRHVIIDGRKATVVDVQDEKLSDFCHLRDTPSIGGGGELTAVKRFKYAECKSCHMLTKPPSAASGVLHLGVHDADSAETWTMKVATLSRLRCNDPVMTHWICCVKAKGEVHSDFLLRT